MSWDPVRFEIAFDGGLSTQRTDGIADPATWSRAENVRYNPGSGTPGKQPPFQQTVDLSADDCHGTMMSTDGNTTIVLNNDREDGCTPRVVSSDGTTYREVSRIDPANDLPAQSLPYLTIDEAGTLGNASWRAYHGTAATDQVHAIRARDGYIYSLCTHNGEMVSRVTEYPGSTDVVEPLAETVGHTPMGVFEVTDPSALPSIVRKIYAFRLTTGGDIQYSLMTSTSIGAWTNLITSTGSTQAAVYAPTDGAVLLFAYRDSGATLRMRALLGDLTSYWGPIAHPSGYTSTTAAGNPLSVVYSSSYAWVAFTRAADWTVHYWRVDIGDGLNGISGQACSATSPTARPYSHTAVGLVNDTDVILYGAVRAVDIGATLTTGTNTSTSLIRMNLLEGSTLYGETDFRHVGPACQPGHTTSDNPTADNGIPLVFITRAARSDTGGTLDPSIQACTVSKVEASGGAGSSYLKLNPVAQLGVDLYQPDTLSDSGSATLYANTRPMGRSGETDMLVPYRGTNDERWAALGEFGQVAYPVQSSDGAVIPGAMPLAHAGGRLMEAAMLKSPSIHYYKLGTGGTLTAGTYSLQAVFEYTDARGQLHRSAPCDISPSVSISGTERIATFVEYPPSLLDGAGVESLRVALYATEAGGSVYYRVGENDRSAFPFPYTTQDIPDGLSSDPDTSAEVLYSQAEVAAEHIPPVRDAAQVGDRIWLIDAETGELWFSKPKQRTVAWEWSSQLRIEIPSATKPVAVLDSGAGWPIIFTKDDAWIVQGAGPDATGTTGFEPPQRVASVGCESAVLAMRIPTVGVVVKSQDGWFAVGPSGETQPFGVEVEDDLADCTSISLLHSTSEARFNRDGTDNALVYNWSSGRWSLDESGTGGYELVSYSGDVKELISTTLRQGKSYASGDSTDPGAWTFRTQWLAGPSPNDELSWDDMVLMFANPASTSSLTVRFYKDYSASVVHTETISAGDIATHNRIQFPFDKAYAARVEIVEGVPSGPASLNELTPVRLTINARTPGKVGRTYGYNG